MAGRRYSSVAAYQFRRRVNSNEARDIADLLDIDRHDVFSGQSDPAKALWDWLERRDRLGDLPNALREINNPDLANLLEQHEITDPSASATPGRPPSRLRVALFGVVAAVVLISVATIIHWWPDEKPPKEPAKRATTAPTTATADLGRAVKVHTVPSVTLRSSSRPCNGHPDKFDLDTNERGHGDQPQIPGCTGAGRLADLILDPERLHAPGDKPLMVHLPSGSEADVQQCADAFADAATDLSGSIPLAKLAKDDSLCVRTDEGLVSCIHIVDVTMSPATLTFTAAVWKIPS